MALPRPEGLRLERVEQGWVQVKPSPRPLALALEEPRQRVFAPQRPQQAGVLQLWEVLAVVLLKEARPRPWLFVAAGLGVHRPMWVLRQW